MGYNGGINKRGYYRRNHGMFSKSSYRSGEKILSNLIIGGLGLLDFGFSPLFDIADSSPNLTTEKNRPLNPRSVQTKYLVCGILSLICPIAGILTYIYAYWMLFFSLLVFGGIGFFISLFTISLGNTFYFNETLGKYLYKDEINTLKFEYQKILKIHIVFRIVSTILNLYPFILIIYNSEISSICFCGATINFYISILLTVYAFEDYKDLDKTLTEFSLFRKTTTPHQTSTDPKKD